METYRIPLSRARAILEATKHARVAFIGDMCLDAYWCADMKRSVLSKETPHHPLPIVEERYAPGGGGNVAANLAALGVGSLHALSILGDDWRGLLLSRELEQRGIGLSGVVTTAHWRTSAYCKPLRGGLSDVVYEDPRLDFENDSPPPAEAEEALLRTIERLPGMVDAVAVTEQLTCGVMTARVREAVCALGKYMPIVVDSRVQAQLYRNVIVKPNEHEAALFGVDAADENAIKTISTITTAPAIITLGAAGAVLFDGCNTVHAAAFPCEPPIDIVGAGDTFLAMVTAALASGANLAESVSLGCAASAVTVKKCGETGTATTSEILTVFEKRKA